MKNKVISKLHTYYIKKDFKSIDKILKKSAPKTLIKFCCGKYTDSDNDYLDTLRNDELWLSSPKSFNDPFDACYNIDYKKFARASYDYMVQREYGRNPQKIVNRAAQEELLEKFESDMQNCISDLLERAYTTCFSEKENLLSSPMWGHYADCHRGFCVEYEFSSLRKYEIFPVYYTKEYPILAGSIKNAREMSLEWIYNKSTDWAYEKEWRIYATAFMPVNQLGLLIKVDKPNAVYLGCMANDRLKNDIIKICKDKKIDLFKMEIIPNTFEIKPVKIEM